MFGLFSSPKESECLRFIRGVLTTPHIRIEYNDYYTEIYYPDIIVRIKNRWPMDSEVIIRDNYIKLYRLDSKSEVLVKEKFSIEKKRDKMISDIKMKYLAIAEGVA